MVDFIMKLPVVARKNAILVVCDQLSKMTHLCYDSRLKVSSQETTLVLSNTRELDGVLSTK